LLANKTETQLASHLSFPLNAAKCSSAAILGMSVALTVMEKRCIICVHGHKNYTKSVMSV